MAVTIFPKRSPNLPAFTVRALFLQRLRTHACIAPVPELANITHSSITKSFKRRSLASLKISSNSGVLWCNVGVAIACRTDSGTGVGPGVKSSIIFLDKYIEKFII